MSVETLNLIEEIKINDQRRVNKLNVYKQEDKIQFKIVNGKSRETGKELYAKIKLDRGQAHLLMLWLQEKLNGK